MKQTKNYSNENFISITGFRVFVSNTTPARLLRFTVQITSHFFTPNHYFPRTQAW